MFDPYKVKTEFPALNRRVYGKPLVYLDNAATTQKPVSVINKIAEAYEAANGNIHRGAHYLGDAADRNYEEARETVREFIGAESIQEIIFTSGATDSINAAAFMAGELLVGAGDNIISTRMEHHSNIVPWQMMCRRKGAQLKPLPVTDSGALDYDMLEQLMDDRTRIITVAQVSNAIGVVNDIKRITAQARSRGIPVLVDGAQAIRHFDVDVKELGCSLYVFSGHKMYAETGIGVLYCEKKLLSEFSPFKGGGGMVADVNMDRSLYAELPYRFEAGTPNYIGAVSLAEAVKYLKEKGPKQARAHEAELYEYAGSELKKISGITVYGEKEKRCGALSFNLRGIHHYDAGAALDKLGIAVRTGKHCAQPLMESLGVPGTVRASFAVYNTREDVAALINGIKKISSILA